ncbi:hypothetical protein Bbelb_097890 [Branchiostoma belcheri]|nr:hypothetical protein Bbelb_097890 [Branchiostoma belcheri]
MASETDTLERYKASMVLSGVGDALGYKNQEWEYNKSGPDIHKQLADLGGLSNITVELPGWPVSDDTVMHLATAEALVIDSEKKEHIYLELCRRYVACMNDMEGRKPGPTSILGCQQMSPTNAAGGWHIPFNPTGTGCGAAMRAMCIGLRCPRPDQLDDLIAFSVESGRMTHHNPHGYCGALASALFVSYCVQGKPLREWGKGYCGALALALFMSYCVQGKPLRELLWSSCVGPVYVLLRYCGALASALFVSYAVQGKPLREWALDYVKKSIRSAYENEEAWFYFPAKWEEYLEERGLLDGTSDPTWPENYDDPAVRDKIYKNDISSDGWPGRRGHDAPLIAYDALLAAGNSWEELCSRAMFHGGMYSYSTVTGQDNASLIAYDALLAAGGNWEELCSRAMFHGGDSDSTGVIAAACFGVLYGYEGVPACNHEKLEYRSRLEKLGEQLYHKSHP